MTDAVIQVEALERSFGSTRALDGLTVAIGSGATGLLGPNGAGKTTLLRVLLGHVRPDRGTVRVQSLDPTGGAERLAIRRRVGYMPEGDCLLPGYSAVEWVALLGRMTGMSRSDALSRSHEVLDYVGIDEARYRRALEYSTGMKQRVKLAQALVHDPPILLLDEPTNGLDPKGRRHMLELIGDLAVVQGKHVVLCTHLLPDVERTCEHVVALRGGRAVLQGTIAELTTCDGRTLEIEVAGPVEGFVAELQRLLYACEVTRDGRVHVATAANDGIGDALFAAAERSGTYIRTMTESRSSLEEALFAGVAGALR